MLSATLPVLLASTLSTITAPDDWVPGAPELQSIGALTFGPPGVLFVADSQGAAVYAIDTRDTQAPKKAPKLDVPEVGEVLAYLTGTSAEHVRIHDLAVNPVSGCAYLSVTRGGGEQEHHVLVRVSGSQKLEVLDLATLRHQRAQIANAPEPGGAGRRNQRAMSITDLEFYEDVLYVAGLSNEEFASKLRGIAFPFDGKTVETSVEIYHASHGAWETRSPVRTFLPMDIGGEPHLLAGYTCTPLVKFPIKDLLADMKIVGTTVAELGNRNTPLDMVAYEKGGAPFLLIANTSRGVMKVDAKALIEASGLTERVGGPSGVSYETIETLQGVRQLADLGNGRALVLIESEGSLSLKAIDLP